MWGCSSALRSVFEGNTVCYEFSPTTPKQWENPGSKALESISAGQRAARKDVSPVMMK